jgi:hypothetical protein
VDGVRALKEKLPMGFDTHREVRDRNVFLHQRAKP